MTPSEPAREAVDRFLADGDESALSMVKKTADLQRAVEQRQQTVVLAAQEQHSWAEIGAALGVSKQAAHRKFVASFADEIKAKQQEMKHARRVGRVEDAAAALGEVIVKAETLRKVRRVR